MTTEYLGVTDVAKRLGISTAAVSAYKLPEPDATIGPHSRMGSPTPSTDGTPVVPVAGVGGGRPRKNKTE